MLNFFVFIFLLPSLLLIFWFIFLRKNNKSNDNLTEKIGSKFALKIYNDSSKDNPSFSETDSYPPSFFSNFSPLDLNELNEKSDSGLFDALAGIQSIKSIRYKSISPKKGI